MVTCYRKGLVSGAIFVFIFALLDMPKVIKLLYVTNHSRHCYIDIFNIFSQTMFLKNVRCFGIKFQQKKRILKFHNLQNTTNSKQIKNNKPNNFSSRLMAK